MAIASSYHDQYRSTRPGTPPPRPPSCSAASRIHPPGYPARARRRRGFQLEAASMAWMVVAATVAIAAHSIALVGFGLGSIVELVAAGVVVWQLRGDLADLAAETSFCAALSATAGRQGRLGALGRRRPGGLNRPACSPRIPPGLTEDRACRVPRQALHRGSVRPAAPGCHRDRPHRRCPRRHHGRPSSSSAQVHPRRTCRRRLPKVPSVPGHVPLWRGRGRRHRPYQDPQDPCEAARSAAGRRGRDGHGDRAGGR
jgi:hypothetical protein